MDSLEAGLSNSNAPGDGNALSRLSGIGPLLRRSWRASKISPSDAPDQFDLTKPFDPAMLKDAHKSKLDPKKLLMAELKKDEGM